MKKPGIAIVALVFVLGMGVGVGWRIARTNDRFEIRRARDQVLEVWSEGELKGEYEPKDGDIYEFLWDIDRGRL